MFLGGISRWTCNWFELMEIARLITVNLKIFWTLKTRNSQKKSPFFARFGTIFRTMMSLKDKLTDVTI